MKKRFLTVGLAVALMSGQMLTGCNSLKKLTRAEKGAIIGVGAGGAIGGAIGSKSKNPAVYAIVGSAIGGAAGAVIGKYMDKQAKEMEDELDGIAKVERLEEGIKVTMDSGLLFGFDSYTIPANTKTELAKLASILEEYPDTEILVAGHTDNVGTEAYNQTLSEDRADAVADQLVANGVKRSRLVVMGFGESAPTYSNETEAGQKQNRRVELAIVANENLKKDAKKEVMSVSMAK